MISAITEAEELYGPADCLVNNAGVMLLGIVSEQNPDEWQKMLNINVMGLLNGIHGVLSSMRVRKKGTIINISSWPEEIAMRIMPYTVAPSLQYMGSEKRCGKEVAMTI